MFFFLLIITIDCDSPMIRLEGKDRNFEHWLSHSLARKFEDKLYTDYKGMHNQTTNPASLQRCRILQCSHPIPSFFNPKNMPSVQIPTIAQIIIPHALSPGPQSLV